MLPVFLVSIVFQSVSDVLLFSISLGAGGDKTGCLMSVFRSPGVIIRPGLGNAYRWGDMRGDMRGDMGGYMRGDRRRGFEVALPSKQRASGALSPRLPSIYPGSICVSDNPRLGNHGLRLMRGSDALKSWGRVQPGHRTCTLLPFEYTEAQVERLDPCLGGFCLAAPHDLGQDGLQLGCQDSKANPSVCVKILGRFKRTCHSVERNVLRTGRLVPAILKHLRRVAIDEAPERCFPSPRRAVDSMTKPRTITRARTSPKTELRASTRTRAGTRKRRRS